MGDIKNNQISRNIFWSGVQTFSVQGVQFLFGLFLARILTPEEFGIIAIANIFIYIAQVVIDSGFSNALIQKNDCTEKDFSTVFYSNIVISLVVYCILFCTASFVGKYYGIDILDGVIKLIGVNVLVSALSIIHRTKLMIKSDFFLLAKCSFISAIVSALLAILLAYYNFGIWALVAQLLISSFLNTILLIYYVKWWPKLIFSIASFKRLFGFGSKILLSNIIETIYRNLYTIIIGKGYSTSDVGFFNRAYQLAYFPSTNLMNVVSRAIYPIQCRLQYDDNSNQLFFLRYLQIACFLIFPFMIILAVLAEPIITLLLTDKWLPSANLLAILCFSNMWYPIEIINNDVLNSNGRSDCFLKQNILKKVIAIIILFITYPLGIIYLCLGLVLYNIIAIFISMYFTAKVINVEMCVQVTIILKIFLNAFIMGCIVLLLSNRIENSLVNILLSTIVGLILYIFISYIFKNSALFMLMTIIKRK